MNVYFLALLLLISETAYSPYGQLLPETNNKRHYTPVTARKEAALLYQKIKAGYSFR